jgi:hypothetical protein
MLNAELLALDAVLQPIEAHVNALRQARRDMYNNNKYVSVIYALILPIYNNPLCRTQHGQFYKVVVQSYSLKHQKKNCPLCKTVKD